MNTSYIGTPEAPKVRLPGSGGANDIISLCNEIFIVTTHEPRRFVERVDFITSPGHLRGENTRAESGLVFGEVSAVATDLALLDFATESRRMRLRALQPGVSVAQVQEATGFELLVHESVDELPEVTTDELAILRDLNGAEVGAA
ncbi:CoA-transferase [Saccharopolyspora spinosporotrichia]